MINKVMQPTVLNKTTLIFILIVFGFFQSYSFAKAVDEPCLSSIKNASYTGQYKGVENNLSTADFTRDLHCADYFKSTKYPNGFVTVFGSSRIGEKSQLDDPKIRSANDQLYQQVYNLAYRWTQKYASQYPILSGAGPGIMEATSRGAMDAGGPSIGYTTYYGPSRNIKGGDASKAFWQYRPATGKSQTLISDGLIFTSVAIRESLMITHSAAMIFAPGGTGTEWELFQAIEQMKSHQLNQVPIYIVGKKKIHWQSFYQRLEDMIVRGTIKRHEVEALIVHVDNPEDVLKLLSNDLKLN